MSVSEPGMSRWEPIDLPLSDKLMEVLGDRPPLQLWTREFDTVDEPEEWRNFLYDPLSALIEAGIVAEQQSEEARPWRVSTHIVNHHKPLNPRIGFTSVIMDPSEAEVGVTIYKVEKG